MCIRDRARRIAEEDARKAVEEEAARIAVEEEACKVSELNGEYIATWSFRSVSDNKEPDFQGSERLILDGCVGEFEGVESFQPSKELRKNLHVSYKTNGQITISGHIDLWDVGRSYHTVLKGDLNSGEILDFWGNGSDLIKIELIKKAQSSPLFDGRYSFDLFRYRDEKDWLEIGNGFVEGRNGIMTVAKEDRTLDTGSIDLYDSFAGQIDKKGNIISSLKIPVLFGDDSTPSVDLNGSIDSQLQGKWNNYFDVILKLGEKE